MLAVMMLAKRCFGMGERRCVVGRRSRKSVRAFGLDVQMERKCEMIFALQYLKWFLAAVFACLECVDDLNCVDYLGCVDIVDVVEVLALYLW